MKALIEGVKRGIKIVDATAGKKCPKCGSTDIRFNGKRTSRLSRAQFSFECLKCSKTWDEYKDGEMVRESIDATKDLLKMLREKNLWE